MSKWHIYGLYEPGKQHVRYVGYTIDPHGRLLRHISNARVRRRNYPLYDWIRSLLKRDLKPEMRILESGDGDGWQEAEKRWISEYRPAGLFNITEGGYSAVIPPQSRKRAGEKLKTRVFTDEHKARLSEAKKGRPRPDNAARNRIIAAGNIGKKMNLSDAERTRRRNRMLEICAKKRCAE